MGSDAMGTGNRAGGLVMNVHREPQEQKDPEWPVSQLSPSLVPLKKVRPLKFRPHS